MLSNVFNVVETTIDEIHAAIKAGSLTVRQLVQLYLDRIAAYDKKGPAINALISINPHALDDADALDQAFARSGFVGPLHGIPVIIKDQADVKGMPTTMGSALFEGYMPNRDGFTVAKLRKAGVVFLAKSTLGELGAGDTHGSLFGSSRNVYDLERTTGGSSGGSGSSVSANFCTAAIGQEGFASIRRPSIWNGICGMRPTAGLVSRSGVYAGWPTINGSLGPMARTVTDLAKVLDCMVGYDPDDPVTALGVGHSPQSYAEGLAAEGLKGARIGILREPMGFRTQPNSDEFKSITEVFDVAVADIRRAGAEVIDPITIPDLVPLLSKRARSTEGDEAAFSAYLRGVPNAPFATRKEAMASPQFAKISRGARERWERKNSAEEHHEYLKARDLLMINLHKVMADHRLDAIVHKAVEHPPTLIKDGLNPPYLDQIGAPHLNTFLVYVPSVVVPAGFTRDNLPAGITFLGRPYSDAAMLRLAYAYEQATRHRRPPKTTP
jgi:Asp-tRNA(Asn)/Glu-tRNA(Gln) amidotransferase A subunit family amidase